MASKKDPRRLNLVVPYQAPKSSGESSDLTSSMSSVMPMAAMMTRNRYIGWGSVVVSVVSWLGEGEDAKKAGATGIFSVGMSLMALVVTYLPMFLPQPGQPRAAAPAPAAPVAVN